MATIGTIGWFADRVVAEYREMPGLSLTGPQAARLFGLALDPCVALLQRLVAEGRLRRTGDGRYVAASDLERVRPSGPPRPRRAVA